MARVTVEKCRGIVRDNFELVVLAATRAKDINSGAHVALERGKDKDSVLALREIESGCISIEVLKERCIAMLQRGSVIESQQEESVIAASEEDLNDDFIFDLDEETELSFSDVEDDISEEMDFGDNHIEKDEDGNDDKHSF